MESATQLLHRLTSYRPDVEWDVPVDDPRVVANLEVNDFGRFPWFFKRYQSDLPVTQLPRDLPATTTPALEVLAGTTELDPHRLDLGELSRLLHLSAGVTRTMDHHHAGTWLFRAAGSAGGRFPLEVYVAVPQGGPVPAGVHWYNPLEHALVLVGPPPAGDDPTIVVTGVPWRTGWRYRERGYRHTYWDAGTMLAQLLAASDSAGLDARLYTRFPDAAVADLVGADRVHEIPVALVSLGRSGPAIEPAGRAARGEVDAAPLEFPLVTRAQRAGESDRLGPSWSRGDPVVLTEDGSAPIDAAILRRGSQRRMDGTRSLPSSLMRTAMSVATRGVDVAHRIAVHAVDGLEPGIYRWPDLTAPARPGDLRPEVYRACLDQGLGRDAAFVTMAVTRIADLDDRQYREAHLGAGLVEGRLHLAAYALGASASGMTFADSEIPGLLGEPLDGVLFTCVGVPEYKAAAGGLPGRPTLVGQVRPRIQDAS